MACWSAENATKAYLRALNMGKRGKEPDEAEFISALAAGNNAQFMVIVTSGIAGPATLSLVAAAHQTGGRVFCILPSPSTFAPSKAALGPYSDDVNFAIGDARALLSDQNYKEVDFVLIDCAIDDSKGVYRVAEERLSEHGRRKGGGHIVGYNAFHKGTWTALNKTHFLPIGDGLIVTRISCSNLGPRGSPRKRSKWVTKVDICTGEEHVYRVTCAQQKIEA